MPSSTVPTTVRLTEDSQSKLAHLSRMTNRSKSYLINRAVESYLAERSAYLQELNEAVASIETKPTYPAEDIFSWMKTWGTDNEKSFSDTKISISKKH